MGTLDRRGFLKAGAAATALALSARARGQAQGANNRVIVGLMGAGGRGSFLADEFARRDDVELRCVADPDLNRANACAKSLEKLTSKAPAVHQDFRRMLDDREIDALIVATPDHWHALGTIMACQAGKDVYVEKPTSHSIWESRKMVEAARRHQRVVQVGAQNRSNDNIAQALEYAHSAEFGDIHFVRVLNSKVRGALGKKPDLPNPPEGVDFDLWLGPAPSRPYNENRIHGWNWFWDYSGGDIINDGVHQVDVARWVIGHKHPKSVVSAGGIYSFKDDQETPDTMTVNWEYDDMEMVFEQVQWAPYLTKTALNARDTDGIPNWPFNGTRVEVHGTKQLMFLGRHGDGWQVFDADGKAVRTEPGQFTPSNLRHRDNFIDCIRSRQLPVSDIEELHLSTLLCHYGNIAYRVGRKIHIDPDTEGITNDEEANALVKRAYRAPFVVPETV